MIKDKLQVNLSVTRMTIIICWLSLISFWVIKIFGGNWFEIMVNNENFTAFSNTVQNSWLKYIVSFFTISTLNFLTFGAILQKFKFTGKQAIIIVSLIVSIWAVVNFVPLQFSFISANYTYVLFVLLSFVYNNGKNKWYGLIAVLLDNLFSVLSIMIRDVKLQIVTDYLVLLILCIDIYIMTALYYLYSNLLRLKKGG